MTPEERHILELRAAASKANRDLALALRAMKKRKREERRAAEMQSGKEFK